MITEDVDDSKHLPMTENPEDEDIEDSSKTEQKHQEFAHTKGQLILKFPFGVFKSSQKRFRYFPLAFSDLLYNKRIDPPQPPYFM